MKQVAPDGKEGTPGHPEVLSLARPQRPQRLVSFAATPMRLEIDLARTALVIVDMQNDFCHPDGWFPRRGVDLAPTLAVIPAIERVATALRAEGVPVVWLNWRVRTDRANSRIA